MNKMNINNTQHRTSALRTNHVVAFKTAFLWSISNPMLSRRLRETHDAIPNHDEPTIITLATLRAA